MLIWLNFLVAVPLCDYVFLHGTPLSNQGNQICNVSWMIFLILALILRFIMHNSRYVPNLFNLSIFGQLNYSSSKLSLPSTIKYFRLTVNIPSNTFDFSIRPMIFKLIGSLLKLCLPFQMTYEIPSHSS